MSRCQVWDNESGILQVPISAKFILEFDLGSPRMIYHDLVNFCGTHLLERESNSTKYLRTLRQIQTFDDTLTLEDRIETPVKLSLEDYSGDYVNLLKDIARAEKTIQEEFETFSDREREWERSEAEEFRIYYTEDGEQYIQQGDIWSDVMRCAFVLEPMFVQVSDLFGLQVHIAEALEQQIGDYMWFSVLDVIMPLDRESAESELEARKIFGLLVRRLFDSVRRKKRFTHISYCFGRYRGPNPSQIEALNVLFEAPMPAWDIEAMCSAIVLTQTTTRLSLELRIDAGDQTMRKHWFEWLAYALFSKRARSRSSLKNLIVSGLGRLNGGDVRAFTSVLESEHPEEMLFGTPRGLVNERDATLSNGSPIRWQLDDQGEPVVDSSPLCLEYPVPFVRTFSDDGESEWMNVIVPGFGRCQVQRCDLKFNVVHAATNVRSGGITSLTIDTDRIIMDGLLPFIESVGSSLRTLTINKLTGFFGGVDGNALIRSCPNLIELTLSGDLVDIQLDFTEYRLARRPISELIFVWDNVIEFTNALSDRNHPLTKCMRRLKVYLQSRVLLPGMAWNFDFYVDTLVDMLKANDRLEYVEVLSPDPIYEREIMEFHWKPIHRQLKTLPKQCKAAFLSLTSAAHSESSKKTKVLMEDFGGRSLVEKMDQHLIANIFSFAATPIKRLVFFDLRSSTE